MKGVILAGGTGSRLYPLTSVVNKHLLPIYNKPMIYYSISTLISIGVDDIIVLTNEHDLLLYKDLLGDGADIGIRIRYKSQPVANGIADAMFFVEDCINEQFILLLGDNIFCGLDLELVKSSFSTNYGATIFVYPVKDSRRFGVVTFDKNNNPLSIVEKPANDNISPYAITGMYIFDANVFERIKEIEYSVRKELEISDLNNSYLKDCMLEVKFLNQECVWFDAGTVESRMAASNYVYLSEKNSGYLFGCPEYEAYKSGFIDSDKYKMLMSKYTNMNVQ